MICGFSHHHGVTRRNKPVQHADQFLDVRHVQADRRLVEDIEGVWGTDAPARARPRFDGSRLRELRHQLEPLRLAAREGSSMVRDSNRLYRSLGNLHVVIRAG